MPKTPAYPVLLDETRRISITNLRNWGFLVPNQVSYKNINWYVGKIKTGSVSIVVDTRIENPLIQLSYILDKNKSIEYKVPLVTIPSNLGIGRIWYFHCPATKKRCRVLYFANGYFLHRKAFNNCLYTKQTYSKANRTFFKLMDYEFKSEEAYEILYSKHFRKTYAGIHTKRYNRLNKWL